MSNDRAYNRRYLNVGPELIEMENRRLAKQAQCTHDITTTFKKFTKHSTVCSQCGKVTDSDAFHEDEVKSVEQFI